MAFAIGTVLGVKDRSTQERPWFVVVIQEDTFDREGFPERRNKHLNVFGQSVREGLHNSFRAFIDSGKPVIAPYSEQAGDKGDVRCFLSGPAQDLALFAGAASASVKPSSVPNPTSAPPVSAPGGLASAAAAAAAGIK